jgi:hypothetical protein
LGKPLAHPGGADGKTNTSSLVAAPSAMWGKGTAVLLALAGLASLPLLVGTTVAGFTWLIVPMFALTIALAEGVRRTVPRVPRLPVALFAITIALAVVSVAIGWLNGLSDEPYSTPAYASLGLAMYSQPLSFHYVQYGVVHFEQSYDVYLPFLTYIQVPGLDYRWVALAAWVGMIYVVRRDPFAAAGLSAPWIGILAANGQNDFVPLVAVTAALVWRPTRGRWVLEAGSLGLKQFANVLVFGYHLVRREYQLAAGAIVVTFAFLAPFLLLDPGGVWCHVVIGAPGGSCQGHPWTFFVFKRNYWLYPAWVVLVFRDAILKRALVLRRRFGSAEMNAA